LPIGKRYDETVTEMDTRTQDVPGPYVWSAPGNNVTIHLEIGVLERLGTEVMRGFGAVPKRGAEVGGLLLGTIERSGEHGEQTIVRIEDFKPVGCGYKRGPSYLLTDEDGRAFADACRRLDRNSGEEAYAVGYYRSHTREGLNFASEDAEVMNHYFPDASGVALLIRPNATRASIAGFFVREEGVFPETTPLEFPFRRWELTGEERPAHRSIADRRRERMGPELVRPSRRADPGPAQTDPPPAEKVETPFVSPTLEPSVKKKQPRWMWMPLSFMFLLLGVALGLLVGLKVTGAGTPQDFALSLSVEKSGDNLTVRWNRNAAAIHAAQRGVLEIDDGDSSPAPVNLDLAHLDSGSMIYRNSSKTVRFRLVIYETSRVTVTEAAEWQE
jgi:hypothetical protein